MFGGGAEAGTKGTLAYQGRGLTRSWAMEEDYGVRMGDKIGHRGMREPHVDAYGKRWSSRKEAP